MSAPLLIHQRLLSKTAPSKRPGASRWRDDFRPAISLAGVSHDRSEPSASEHQPEQREHPVPVLSRRVGHRRVHYPKRPGQRDAQPAEQLWQQLLGVLGERNVPRWLPHHLAQQLTDLLGLLELVELAHSFLNALGDRKVLRRNHVTPVPLGRVAPGYGNVIDLLVDELPETTYVVLVDLDACDRAEEPFEHRNTRRMGHALPPVRRSRLARSGRHLTFALRRRLRTGPAGAISPGRFGLTGHRNQGTHFGRSSGATACGVRILLRRAYPQRCFSIRRAGVGPSPAFPLLAPCKSGLRG